jgi:hypothetical protein
MRRGYARRITCASGSKRIVYVGALEHASS